MRYLLLVLLLSQNILLIAQEIAPFQLEDASNLKIDQEAIQQITGKEWVMYERRMYVRERVRYLSILISLLFMLMGLLNKQIKYL